MIISKRISCDQSIRKTSQNEVSHMMKNMNRLEQIGRVVLAILFGIPACFASSWSEWARIGSGIIAVAFLGTALVGY
jgi:hypothetical protein